MSKVLPKSFTYFYNVYCNENNAKSKLHLVDHRFLKINADRLEKDDWAPIIKALENCDQDLHSVVVQSKYLSKFRQRRTGKLKETIDGEPAFFKETLLKLIVQSLSKILVNSNILCTFSLEGFPLNSSLVEMLIYSVRLNTCLQHLGLANCTLTEDDISCLCKAISIHTGLQTFDLSNCGVTCNGAKKISDLIRSQKLVRYGETWKQSLRYRTPKPDLVPGLRRLTLNDNYELGDEGFMIISHELIDDLWFKAIDFQNCSITNKSSECAIDLVKTNPIIKILDLRRNNIPDNILQEISKILKTGNNSDGDNYNWIDCNGTSISNVSLVSKSKPQIQSASNSRINSSVEKSRQAINKPNDKRISNGVINELERTKNILHKVSSRLFEEKTKREAIEKQHVQLKDQIDMIRSCVSQHFITNINSVNIDKNRAATTFSNISTKHSVTSKNCRKQNTRNHEKLKKNKKVNSIKKNNQTSNKANKNKGNSTGCSIKPAKLVLLVPATKNKNFNNNCIGLEVLGDKIVQLKSCKIKN